jgi:hypothetical protein
MMSPESFCYWLSGFFEISQHSEITQSLNAEQVEEIRNHLKLVMSKVTPDISQQRGVQLPLFPSYQPVMPPFNPGLEHDSSGVRPSWPHYPQVSCCSGDVLTFHHTGD